jgi:stress-induced morphogen
MIAQEDVEDRLSQEFPDAEISVRDVSGSQDSYQARVVSQQFEGKSLFEQHQLVYQALGDALYSAMASFSVQTYTPHGWQRLRGAAK